MATSISGKRKWLQDTRLKAGLSQEALGELVGMPQHRISKYESGYGISIANAKRIASALDIPWTRFFEEEKNITGIRTKEDKL
jgi:transcriptional regulator with XRE-family HTH domain